MLLILVAVLTTGMTTHASASLCRVTLPHNARWSIGVVVIVAAHNGAATTTTCGHSTAQRAEPCVLRRRCGLCFATLLLEKEGKEFIPL